MTLGRFHWKYIKFVIVFAMLVDGLVQLKNVTTHIPSVQLFTGYLYLMIVGFVLGFITYGVDWYHGNGGNVFGLLNRGVLFAFAVPGMLAGMVGLLLFHGWFAWLMFLVVLFGVDGVFFVIRLAQEFYRTRPQNSFEGTNVIHIRAEK